MPARIYTDVERQHLQAAHKLVRREALFFALIPMKLPNELREEPPVLFVVRRQKRLKKLGRFRTLVKRLKNDYARELDIVLHVNRAIIGEATYGGDGEDEASGRLLLRGTGPPLPEGRLNRAMLQIAALESVPRFRRFSLVDQHDGEAVEIVSEQIDSDVDARIWEARVLADLRRIPAELSDLEAEALAALEDEEDALVDAVTVLLGPAPQDLLAILPAELLAGAEQFALAVGSLRGPTFHVVHRINELAAVLYDRDFEPLDDEEQAPGPDPVERDRFRSIAKQLPVALGMDHFLRVGTSLQALAQISADTGGLEAPEARKPLHSLVRELEAFVSLGSDPPAREVSRSDPAFGVTIPADQVLTTATIAPLRTAAKELLGALDES